jgi:DNA polymerase-1
MNIKIYEIDTFEADDIIGSLTDFSEANGLHPLVITGDKDELQLVSDMTTVLITKKGLSEFDFFTPEKVHEKYGFGPEKIIDFKGLMGLKTS